MSQLDLIITKYFETDKLYYQSLNTIYHSISTDQIDKFLILLLNAEIANKKLSVKKEKLAGFRDSLSVEEIEIL